MNRNYFLALAVANPNNSALFNLFLKDFTNVVHGHIYTTHELKSSAIRVRNLITNWLKSAEGILAKRIVDFQEDFELCLRVVRNLPSKINKYWQKKLRPWYNYARNLVIEKSSLAACLFKTNCAEIKKAFVKASKMSSQALGQNLSLRQVLGITPEIDAEVILTEAKFSRRESALSDHLTYSEVKKLQQSTPPENSVDPTKSIRLAAEEQLKRRSQWGLK